jgi:prepilin-type N-terminal cleavage/methylation domain-containing protein
MSRRAKHRRGGFTLIEVLIAIVILGSVGVGIAQLMFTSATRSGNAGAISYRAAALATEVNRITALPASSLVDGTTTRTIADRPFPHTVTTVAATASGMQTVTITVTPTGPKAIAARSRTISRAMSTTGPNPFGS